jgi:hypothetical protein
MSGTRAWSKPIALSHPISVVRDEDQIRFIELPLKRWPTLQDAGRLARYIQAQEGESLELTNNIRRMLST